MNAFDLTREGLLRALGNLAARPAVEAAVRARAEALAGEIERTAPGATADVHRRGPADHVVAVSAPGLFAREFGSLEREAEPAIAAAIGRVILPRAAGQVSSRSGDGGGGETA